MARRRLVGTRGVRHVRHPFRGPSELEAHPDAGRICRVSLAKGLSAAWPRGTAQLSGDHAGRIMKEARNPNDEGSTKHEIRNRSPLRASSFGSPSSFVLRIVLL